MLPPERVVAIADDLIAARSSRELLPLLTARNPGMTVEDAYAVQAEWAARRQAAGRRVVGHKIGLTSKVMQQATGIDEPDYGVIFDDQVHHSGVELEVDAYSNVRIEVELAFVLRDALPAGATVDDVLAATAYVQPALEILDSHIELAGRTIVDTISDNAALGGVILGGRKVDPREVDLTWVAAVLWRGDAIEESGVAAAVLGNPPLGVAWLAERLGAHGAVLDAGEIVLAGSFTRPMWVHRGDEIRADYGPLGVIECRFV